MEVHGKDFRIEGRLVRIARLSAEGFEFLDEPEASLSGLRESKSRIDLVTFLQKLPSTVPEYKYPMEWDNVAALPVSTFEQWWKQQIDGKTRNMVRRSEKNKVVMQEVSFDDNLAHGIWEIYNECPVRQGRAFPHYGKDLGEVRRMSATFLESSIFIGAYLGNELIGFIKLTVDDARSQAAVMHIISMVRHRDKASTNALVAEAVKACANRGIPYLVYSKFAFGTKKPDSLSKFKESNGFRRIDLPRYYVPLTGIGRLAFRLGLHHSFMERVPEPAVARLRQFRTAWYARKAPTAMGAS